MLIVPIEDAEPGMKLALSVSHPENPDHELLHSGFVLDEPVLERLGQLAIRTLYVDYPGLEDLDRHFAPALSPARQQIYEQIKATITTVQRSARPMVTYTNYYDLTREMITMLLSQGNNPLYLDLLSTRAGQDAVAHATAVAHLSLNLGIQLQGYLVQQRSRLHPKHAREVVNLGVAGMLHDIGKTKLPAELQKCSCLNPPEDPDQRKRWEEHVRESYEMIHGGVEATAAAAVLHHHQHFDGSGFPIVTRSDSTGPLSGERIHVFARILRVADLYDRLAARVADHPHTRNLRVLHAMRTQHAAVLDPNILQVFAAVVPPFVPGTKVRLSDRADAVVVAPNAKDPWRPMVKHVGADGLTPEGGTVSLEMNGAPHIESAGGEPVGEFMPADNEPLGVAA
ncbi:MAG TPA: HD domain-containing phosphohydrolase [Tepidisphaeraceae bacterium]|nr:HD domain-containing phosphohydrolase [Tepidisphaeraceae bacterium]